MGCMALGPKPLSAREILMRLDQVLSGAPLLLHDASRVSIERAWYDIELKKVGRSRQTSLFTRYLKHDESQLMIDSRIVIEAICAAFDCNDKSLSIFTDCSLGHNYSHQEVDCSDATNSIIAIESIKAPCSSMPCKKRKMGFFRTKMEAFKYANDVPVEEASITERCSNYLVSLQTIATIWSSINCSHGHSSTDISSGIDESALSRVAVAVDSHLRCVLDHCLSNAYDRLGISSTIQGVSTHHSLLLSTPMQTQQELDRQRGKTKSSDMKNAVAGDRDRMQYSGDRIFLQPTIRRHRDLRPSHNVPSEPSSAKSHIRWFEDINAILSAENAAASEIVQNRGLCSSSSSSSSSSCSSSSSSSSSYDPVQVYQYLLRRRVDRAFLERDNSIVPRQSKASSKELFIRELFLKIFATDRGGEADRDDVHSSAVLDGIYAVYNSSNSSSRSQHRNAVTTVEEQESISIGCEALWLHLPPGELYAHWLECFEATDAALRTAPHSDITGTDRTRSIKRRQTPEVVSPRKKYEVTDEDLSNALKKMQRWELYQSACIRNRQYYS